MGQDKNSETDSILLESENDMLKNTDIIFSKTKKEEKKHKCTYPGCEAAFYRPSRLARHVRFHTGERNFKCNFLNCDKAYTNACHLKRHMETHNTTKKLYTCPHCSLSISNLHNLKRHYKTQHTGKLTCKECNKSFTKKYQLASHMTTHAPVLHKCEKCNKSFADVRKFKRHKKSHEGNKQYPCTMSGCNKVFGKWLLLCAHLKTQHVNDHKCKDCNKVFLSKQHLKVHLKVHMENRLVMPCPYEKCPRGYYSKYNLDQHIRTYHLGQKYECDICNIKISTKRRLADHIQNLHMSEKRIKKIKKLHRKKRKDAGIPKRSMVSKLIGINLPPKIEKVILERKHTFSLEEYETVLNNGSHL